MFNKRDYQGAFSKVTASEETYRRVMNMANQKRKHTGRGIVRKALIAAVIVSMLAVTAGAVEYVSGWLAVHFSDNHAKPLSGSQMEYLEENEQKINETQVRDAWTVELRSAIQDGTTAYIIIGVSGPEGVDLEPEIVDGVMQEVFTPGNGGMVGAMSGAPDIISCSEGVIWSQLGFSWEEDGDGKDNTKNYVIQIYPDMERSSVDPFGKDAEYYLHFENIVREYEDEAYRQELMNGKYKGQTDIMFTHEETMRLRCAEVLAEGVWDFTVSFAEREEQGVELLTESVTVVANIFRKVGPNIEDYVHVDDDVTITSFVLRPLSATICYEECNGGPNFTATANGKDRHIYAVMQDGSKIELFNYGTSGVGYSVLEAETPIVLAEVDYVLMADGTKLMMPQMQAE